MERAEGFGNAPCGALAVPRVAGQGFGLLASAFLAVAFAMGYYGCLGADKAGTVGYERQFLVASVCHPAHVCAQMDSGYEELSLVPNRPRLVGCLGAVETHGKHHCQEGTGHAQQPF
jgi:hypothetical protein